MLNFNVFIQNIIKSFYKMVVYSSLIVIYVISLIVCSVSVSSMEGLKKEPVPYSNFPSGREQSKVSMEVKNTEMYNMKIQPEKKEIDDKSQMIDLRTPLPLNEDHSEFQNVDYKLKADIEKGKNSSTNQQVDQFKICEICLCPVAKSHNPEKCKICGPCDPENSTEQHIELAINTNSSGDNVYDTDGNHKKNDILVNSSAKISGIPKKYSEGDKSQGVNDSLLVSSSEVDKKFKSDNNNDIVQDKNVNQDDLYKGEKNNGDKIYDYIDNQNNVEYVTTISRNNDNLREILQDSILMTVVPVIFILIFVIYRKAKHLLERRHYTRTNYLIDGMYSENYPLCVSDVIQLCDS